MFRVGFTERVQGVLNNLEANSDGLVSLQDQLSSGKKLRTPADDPAGTGRDLELRSSQGDNTQYLRNLDQAKSWLDASGSALQDIVSTLQRTRELAIEAANGSLSDTDRQAIGAEVHQLVLHAVSTANAKFGDEYLFSGYATTTTPFTINGSGVVVYNGTDPTTGPSGVIQRELAPGVMMGINVVGTQGFPALFSALQGLDTDLQTLTGNNLVSNVTSVRLGEIDTAITQFTNLLADVGAKENRVTTTQTRLQANNVTISDLLSKTEDLDMAQAITQFSTAQTVYQAALQTGSKVIQLSLLNFLQ